MIVALLVIVGSLSAQAQQVELDLGLSAAAHVSVRQAALGGGPRVSARYVSSKGWSLGGGVAPLLGYRPAAELELELGRSLRSTDTGWKPWVGVELAGVLGTQRFERSDFEGLPRDPALSTRLAIRPLVFEREGVRWSFLELSAGPTWEAPGRGLSVMVAPVSLGFSVL